jgi:hypothetical protein
MRLAAVKKASVVVFSLFILLSGLVYFTKTNIERRAKTAIDQRLNQLAPFVSVNYDRISFNPFFWDMHVYDIQINLPNQHPISIEEIVFEDWDRNRSHPMPYVAAWRIRNAKLPTALLGRDRLLPAWGKNDLLVSFAISLQYEEEHQSLHIKNIHVEVPGAGELAIAANFANVAWQEGIAAVVAKSYTTLLQNMRITYRDDALLDQILAKTATQRGTDQETIRQVWLNDLEAKRQRASQDPKKAQMYASLQTFLRQPDRLTIEFLPESLLPLGRILQATDEDELYTLLEPKITLQ